MDKKAFHILVVDDDDRIRSLVKQYLEDNQFVVTTARDALDAKNKLEASSTRFETRQASVHRFEYFERGVCTSGLECSHICTR